MKNADGADSVRERRSNMNDMNNMNNKPKKGLDKKHLRIGGYSVVVCAVAIVIAVLIYLISTTLPTSLMKFDISGTGIYKITDETKDIIKGINKDVVIYLVAQEGNEKAVEYCERYAELNSHISFKTVDPAVSPTFVGTYTDDTLADNSIIVVNEAESRSKVIPYSDIFDTQYSQEEIYYYYYYGITPTGSTTFMMENELTTAIDYVTNDDLPVVYCTSGHGETAISDAVSEYFNSDNIIIKDLALASTLSVPEDADFVIVNLPEYDFSDDEINALKAYINAGGSVMMTTGYYNIVNNKATSAMPKAKFAAFAAEYGMGYKDGLLCEGNAENIYGNYPYCVFASVTSNSFSSQLSSSANIFLSYSHPLYILEEVSDDITVSKLFSTSDKAYVKTGEFSNVSKADGDESGVFYTGLMAEKTVSDGKTGKLIWFSSADMTSASTVGYYGNIPYLLSVISNVSGKNSSISIAGVSLDIESLSVSQKSANVWGIVIIVLIPVCIIVSGVVIKSRRRKQ